jgi:aquaporin Z
VDRRQLGRWPSDVAVIQSEAAGGTASGSRSAARFALEAAGNFVLVFTFGVAIATHSWFSPLLIAAPLVAMVYFGTRVPGGHYNPALTIAMLIRHRLAPRAALAFWLVQSGAGLLAAVSVRAIIDPRQLAVTAAMTVKGPTLAAAFGLELALTCALCSVAVKVSTRNSHPIDDYYAWPIAFSVIAGAIVIAAITNGAFNPTVSLDDALLAIFSWPTLWVYLVSQLLSGIAATFTFVSLADHH